MEIECNNTVDFASLPKTRKEAFEAGVIHYFTGVPCRHGHLAPRYTSSGECVICSHQKALARAKKWREQFKINRQRRLFGNMMTAVCEASS